MYPPQGCIEDTQRKRTAYPYFFGDMRYDLQNGVHFYTLCSDCNSRIGGEYDRELIAFSEEIRNKTHLFRTHSWQFTCSPNRIARTITAGFLTASRGCVDDSWEEIQKYVRQEIALLPSDIKIGFWPHPYDSVVVKPDFMTIDPSTISGRIRRILFVMKYFLLAWVVYAQDGNDPDFCEQYKVHCFSDYLSSNINDIVRVTVNPTYQKTEYWPNISDGFALLVGQNASDNAVHAQIHS